MTHDSQAPRQEESTRENINSSLLLDVHPGSVTRSMKPFQDRPELSTSGQKSYRQSTFLDNSITAMGRQLFHIQHDHLAQGQLTLEVQPKRSRLGRPSRPAVILPRQLSSSAYPVNYPIYQDTQSAPTAGQSSSYAGAAPSYLGTAPSLGAAPSYLGAVPAYSGAAATYPVQAPSAAGASASSNTGTNNSPAEVDQRTPVHVHPNVPASSSSAPEPLHTAEPHREPSQVNQPASPPASPETTASVARSQTSSAAPAAATAITPPQSPDDSSPTPVAHSRFSLINSSLVVSVPTHVPSANPPPLDAHLSNQSHHHGHHNSDSSPSGALLIIAIALPIVLVLVGVMAFTYRIVKRKRRAHAENRTSYGSQVILADGSQHQLDNMAERKRFSSHLKFPYAMMDDHLSNFAVRGESGSAPPLPPVNSAPPTHPTTLRPNPQEPDNSDPANATNESFKGGVACKMNCLVTRTFNPTMPDELKIDIGDRVLVFMLFDDGWCLGENLEFEKRQGSEGVSRTGVLPQDCLSGIQPTSVAGTSDGAPSFTTAGEFQQEYPVSPDALPPVPLKPSQEILALGASNKPDSKPLYKPERNSSLLCDREAQLFLELDNALSPTS